MTTHCNTCRHWGTSTRAGKHRCTCSRFCEPGDDLAEEPDALVYSYNESGSFWTGPEFGCVHHMFPPPDPVAVETALRESRRGEGSTIDEILGDIHTVHNGDRTWHFKMLVDSCPTCFGPITGLYVEQRWRQVVETSGLKVWIPTIYEVHVKPCGHGIGVTMHCEIVDEPPPPAAMAGAGESGTL